MITSQAILLFLFAADTAAFTSNNNNKWIPHAFSTRNRVKVSEPSSFQHVLRLANKMHDLDEDVTINEQQQQQPHDQSQRQRQQKKYTTTVAPFRKQRRIMLPSEYDGNQKILLASSTTMSPTTTYEDTGSYSGEESSYSMESEMMGSEVESSSTGNGGDSTFAATEEDSTSNHGFDAYGNPLGVVEVEESPTLRKIQQYQEQRSNGMGKIQAKLSTMDLQDFIFTLFIPGILVFTGSRWVYNRVNDRVLSNKGNNIEAFTREMIYHDGNLNEMELCVNEYKKRLLPTIVLKGGTPGKRNTIMLKNYLEAYAKKKSISPKGIQTLSYVLTDLFGMPIDASTNDKKREQNIQKIADLMVSLCREMGTEKVSSAGKLLFLGTRVLQGKKSGPHEALSPIKDLIKSTYRDTDNVIAETLVETSQLAIAEAAYRTTVLQGGKNQKELTSGWDVLGLDAITAQRIFDEEASEGFLTDREMMYGLQTQKYDKKGNRIGKDSKPEGEDDDDDSDPTKAITDEDED